MMRPRAELVLDCRNELGEMPLWQAGTGTLRWIDVTTPGRVFRWDTRSPQAQFQQFDHLVTGLAACAREDEVLLVGGREIWQMDLATLERRLLYALPADEPLHRFNDGGVDRAGRFWVGSMPNNFVEPFKSAGRLEASGKIHVVSTDGEARSFAARLACPNAICWSPDAQTFYVADSVSGWIYAYDFELAAGVIRARREFCRLTDLGIPDGAAVDAEGYLWNARWGAGAVARISPAGQLDRVVELPTTNPTACCFGGRNLDVLYVTSARYGLTAQQLARESTAGGVFAIATAIPGMASAVFAG